MLENLRLQYTQEKLLDRHLDFHGLQQIKESRKIANRATEPLANYIALERRMLERALAKIPDSAAAENLVKSAITQLATDPAYYPPSVISELNQYLSQPTVERLHRTQTGLQQKLREARTTETDDASHAILVADFAKDKQSIFETALRNARLEKNRIRNLLRNHGGVGSRPISQKRSWRFVTIYRRMKWIRLLKRVLKSMRTCPKRCSFPTCKGRLRMTLLS